MNARKQKPVSEQAHPKNFESVLQDELNILRPQANVKHGARAAAHQAKLSGLAFSGGGLRSATFNLGVLQGLARLGILKRFDYFSTVSGGGYIGAWFAAWIRRQIDDQNGQNQQQPEARIGVFRRLFQFYVAPIRAIIRASFSRTAESGKTGAGEASSDGPDEIAQHRYKEGLKQVCEGLGENAQAERPEPSSIAHLREFSNYLTPHRGIWSTDAWTLGVAYVRNLVLTLSVLIGAMTAGVLLARGTMISYGLILNTFSRGRLWLLYGAYTATLMGAAFFISRELQRCRSYSGKQRGLEECPPGAARGAVLLTIVSLWLGTAVLWQFRNLFLAEGLVGPTVIFFALPLIGSLLAGMAGGFSIFRKTGIIDDTMIEDKKNQLKQLLAAMGAALFFFLSVWVEVRWFQSRPGILKWLGPAYWPALMWGPLLTLVSLCIFAAAFVGLSGQDLGELEREWLARLLASVTKFSIVLCLLPVVMIYTPIVLKWLSLKLYANSGSVLAGLWGIVSAVCVFAGQKGKVDLAGKTRPINKVLMALALIVCATGLLVLVVIGVESVLNSDMVNQWLLYRMRPASGAHYWQSTPAVNWTALLTCWMAGALMSLITYIWSRRVGVNIFSLHALYGNRLIRAFLGASNLHRKTHLFTGFDPGDNEVKLSDLIPYKGYRGPYLLINAAINLVHTTRLAWQHRKAGAFVFSPLYCGYEFAGSAKPDTPPGGGYVPSHCYASGKRSEKGISLGKAMTISGAAANPNMGHYSSPATAFLMTLFNVRLGWWLPNTRKKDRTLWAREGPKDGLFYLLSELMGLSDEKGDYVNLSDGGHFENLGIYELVRRRCRFILACDAEADPKIQFTGLATAIERCRADLRIPIDIDLTPLRHDPGTGLSRWHCAVGKIRYDQMHPGMEDGILVYIKATLTGDEPRDIVTYAAKHSSFPHESTADQWFDEMQFESYRALGLHILTRVMGPPADTAQRNHYEKGLPDNRSKTTEEEIEENKAFMEDLFEESALIWEAHMGAFERPSVNHDEILADLIETLRHDSLLKFLDCQLYPDLMKRSRELRKDPDQEPWVPRDYEEMRAGFLFCTRLFQFMQQVFIDLELEFNHGAARHRGWINLFQQWALSRMMRYTWSTTIGNYSRRFQTFCAHHLKLEIGDLSWGGPLEIAVRQIENKIHVQPAIPDTSVAAGQSGPQSDPWQEAGRLFGLNFFEMQLVREYISNHCAFLEATDTIPSFFLVYPLQITTEDPATVDRGHFISFTAGFALAKLTETQPIGPSVLLYLRLRPNMRGLRLSREATEMLYLGKPNLPSNVDAAAIGGRVPSETGWHRRIFLELYPMQQESVSRKYIADMINREIEASAHRRLERWENIE